MEEDDDDGVFVEGDVDFVPHRVLQGDDASDDDPDPPAAAGEAAASCFMCDTTRGSGTDNHRLEVFRAAYTYWAILYLPDMPVGTVAESIAEAHRNAVRVHGLRLPEWSARCVYRHFTHHQVSVAWQAYMEVCTYRDTLCEMDKLPIVVMDGDGEARLQLNLLKMRDRYVAQLGRAVRRFKEAADEAISSTRAELDIAVKRCESSGINDHV